MSDTPSAADASSDTPVNNGASPNLSILSDQTGPMLGRLQEDQAQLDSSSQDLAQIPSFDQQAPQINREGVMATMPYALGLAALAGKVAGIHPMVMLNGMNGMAQGLIHGDQQAYEDARAKYDDAYEKYMDKYKAQFQIYKQMQAVYKGQVNADQKALEIALKATGYEGKIDAEHMKAFQWQEMFAERMKEAKVKQDQAAARIQTQKDSLAERTAKDAATADARKQKQVAADKKTDTNKKALTDADKEIDSLIANIKKHPGSTGVRGYLARGSELVKSSVGMSDDTSAHQIQTQVSSLLLRLPKLLTGTSRSAKDERARVEQIADSMKLGDNDTIAVQNLEELKRILADVRGGGGEDKFTIGSIYTDKNGKRATYMGNNQWKPAQ